MNNAPAPATLDYAPPQRGPAWLTWRRVMLVVLMFAAALSARLVVPRVILQAERLRAQDALLTDVPLAGATTSRGLSVSNAIRLGSRPITNTSTCAITPGLGTFTTWSGPKAISSASFVGGRDAGNGERLVVVEAHPAFSSAEQPPDLLLTTYVYKPGTWLERPKLLTQSALVLQIPTSSVAQTLSVYTGGADPAEPAAFSIPLEVGFAAQDEEVVLFLHGTLLRQDRVSLSFEPRSEDHPVAATPATRPSSTMVTDDHARPDSDAP